MAASVLAFAACESDGASTSDVSTEDVQDTVLGDTAEVPDDTSADTTAADTSVADTSVADTAAQDTTSGELPGETCANAVAIAGAGVLEDQSVAGYRADMQWGGSCGPMGGVERIYSLSLGAGKQLVVTGTPTAQLDIKLALFAGGDADVCASDVECLRGATWNGFGEAETFRYVNYEESAVPLFLAVTGGNMSPGPGTFSLDIAITDAPARPAGDLCTEPVAVVLTDGVASFPGESLEGHENEWAHGNGDCSEFVGRDKFYALTIPAGERLIANHVVTGGTEGGEWAILAGASPCAPAEATCAVMNSLDFGDLAGMRLAYDNATAQPLDVILIVDQYASDNYPGFEPLTYDLSLFVGPPPAGDVCSGATALAAGQTLSGETTVGCLGDYWGPRCAGLFSDASDRVYALTIPAGMQASVTASPEADLDLYLDLIADTGPSACDGPLTCVARSFGDDPGAPRTLTWANRNDTDAHYLLLVSTMWGAGSFDLSLALTTAPARPAGDLCDDAVLLEIPEGGLTLTGQTTAGYGEDYQTDDQSGCLAAQATAGADRVYAVDVPAGERLVASITPDGDANLSAQLLLGDDPAVCASASWTCLAASDQYGSAAEHLSWLNAGEASQRVFVVVDTQELAGSAFILTASVEAPPAGDTCEDPIAVTPPTTLTGQSSVAAGGDYGAPFGVNQCTGYGSDGPDLAYAVEIPANNALSVTVTPLDEGFDPGLYAVKAPASNCGPGQPACPVETCTDGTMSVYFCGSDDGADGEPDTLVIYNYTEATASYLVIVDTFYETGGPFDLSFTLQAL
ncbi:MAG: hypothetical protein EP329_20190 [Deltaproteobacteria bacterium]|nr:MAG: hypothetical protein EP329_20190 [Deltaproteobacteria bacterium]